MAQGNAYNVRGGRMPVPLSSLAQYNPNRADQIEGIWQPFYHKVNYAAAGQASLTFFNVAFSGDYTVTNMPAAAFFPAPTAFLCTAIQLDFVPGSVPGTSNAVPSAALVANWNDVNNVANAGYVEFVIGGKVYLRDSPSGKFPPNDTVMSNSAFGGTLSAPPAISGVNYATAAGRYCEITPFLIPQTQNFSVTFYTPTLVPVTLGTGPFMRAIIDGFYYRQSQ